MGRKSKAKQHRRLVKEQEKLDRMEAAIQQREFPILACECGRVWQNIRRGIWVPKSESKDPECSHPKLHFGRAIFTV